jgi:putative tricarboxylic transport membrane protein
MLTFGLIGVGFWLKVVRVSPAILAPLIFGISVVAAYGIGGSTGDIYIMLVIGVMAYFLRKFKFPMLPIVIAIVLGYLLEISARRALLSAQGNPMVFLQSPISVGLLIIAAITTVLAIRRDIRSAKKG